MTITPTEQADIDRANRSGRQPVVFVHGLWLLPNSWDNWRTLFEEQGFVTIAPRLAGRPGDRRRRPSRSVGLRTQGRRRHHAALRRHHRRP